MMAERMLALELRTKKFVRLSADFTLPAAGMDDRDLNLLDVRERVPYQRRDGTAEELDVVAKADDGTVLLVEVRKRQEPTGIRAVTGLRDNGIDYAQQQGVPVLCAFLSLGGFTEEAKAFCEGCPLPRRRRLPLPGNCVASDYHRKAASAANFLAAEAALGVSRPIHGPFWQMPTVLLAYSPPAPFLILHHQRQQHFVR
ncbi:MAG: hypothetical protein R3E79_56215 [Caldilineaceae bacterium]